MERPMPWDEHVDVISSDESNSSDADAEVSDGFSVFSSRTLDENTILDKTYREISTEGALFRKAEMYQDYMKQIPIPANRGSLVPFTTWIGLGNSIKRLYGQPLHYLTNILLKQWDQSRFGTTDEHQPMDTIIHPSKAEATIWLVEEVHRSTTSHLHIANLWQSDPLYHASVDPIFPNL